MYGDSILVAPIVEEGATSINVWLPEGEWTHLFTKQQFLTGWHLIQAPIGQPAVFVRRNTLWHDFLGKQRV
jgi:alpha-glucosidase